ncbi:MAG: hypothetical protein NTY03_15190 [Candidatus Bathyarchaeota archaeon]|jgi:hypothetical protein|nr:hypothetical protein [Candidatus Bathyarchaeota archaeon]
MKYLLFWEQREMPQVERQKFSKKAREERGNEEKYGVEILPPHYYETGKGITVVEISDSKQLANRMALIAPYTTIRVLPLIRTTMYSESVQEIHGV